MEMVIVLAIIALLMLIVIPNLNAQRESASKRSDAALEQVVQNQREMYASDNNQQIDTVTLEDLRNQHYLNEAQYNTAKANDKKLGKPQNAK